VLFELWNCYGLDAGKEARLQRWPAILADDDPEAVRCVKAALAELDFDVAEAAPTAVFLTAKAHKSALVLVGLPASGATVGVALKMLHRQPGYYHIIGLLDRYDPATVTAAFAAAGADDAIAKPFIPAELEARLRLAKQILVLEDSRRTLEAEGGLLAQISTQATFHSRRYLQAQLGNELARAQRFRHGVAIVVAEVRQHHGSERVMRNFGQLLSGLCRAHIDWIARYGKQSFALVLPETKLAGALCVAARVRERCVDSEAAELPKTLTVNVGVSALEGERIDAYSGHDPQFLLDATDAYLRDAVQKGPGQIAGGPVPHP
jgi:diguanylate cyclase (GGDEF)-like protein